MGVMGKRRLSGGEQLAARLEERGLSQCDLSGKLEVSTSAVSRWVSGERTPSLEMAFRLEDELGIPAEDWLTASTGTDG